MKLEVSKLSCGSCESCGRLLVSVPNSLGAHVHHRAPVCPAWEEGRFECIPQRGWELYDQTPEMRFAIFANGLTDHQPKSAEKSS